MCALRSSKPSSNTAKRPTGPAPTMITSVSYASPAGAETGFSVVISMSPGRAFAVVRPACPPPPTQSRHSPAHTQHDKTARRHFPPRERPDPAMVKRRVPGILRGMKALLRLVAATLALLFAAPAFAQAREQWDGVSRIVVIG